MRRPFTPWEISFIREVYPHVYTYDIAAYLGRTSDSINGKAYGMRIKKDPEFRKMELARQGKRLKKAGPKFQKGHIPDNKGKKMPEDLKIKLQYTFFKKGSTPHNTKYDGHERITDEGYIMIRIKKGHYVLKHRHVWETEHGPIPKDHILTFIDGNKQNTSLANLELITRSEGMARNTIARYPDLRSSLQALSKLKKLINEKQN